MSESVDIEALIAELRECVERGTYTGGGYQYVEVGPEDAIAAADALESLAAERDALRKILDEASVALKNDGLGQPWRLRRIFSRATATEKGTEA